MYLKRLYSQSKWWFVVVMMFAVSQLFIDYKNGIEATPFYHYGMFSLPFHFTNTYDCVEVEVNGKRLQTKDFTPNGWDNIVMPVIQYNHQSQWNGTMYHQTINRLLPFSDSTLYVNDFSQADFDTWCRSRVLRLLNIKDSAAGIQYGIVSYHLQNGVLVK